jgi:RNA polymerase sigma factor (sigma-70 family)
MEERQMQLVQKLNRIFDSKPIFEAISGTVFDRNTWMTADPDALSTVAYTHSRKQFWRALNKIAQEAGDDNVSNYIKTLEQQDPEDVNATLASARSEAREYAAERGATSRKGEALRPKKAIRPDLMGWTPEQITAHYQKQRELAATKAPRKYFGDTLHGMYDTVANDWVKDPQGQIISSPTEAEVRSIIQGDPDKYPNPEQYEVRPYENPKSLSKLKDIKKPIESGWSVDEVVAAMQPWIRKLAYNWQSAKAPVEDLMQHAVIGIINAIRTDKGEAPFGSHAWKHMKGEVRRAALTGGVIKQPEEHIPGEIRRKLGISLGTSAQAGPLVGYDVIWIDQDKKPNKKHFPAELSAYEKHASGAPMKVDPAFQRAKEFEKELKAQGLLAATKSVRSKMRSADAPSKSGDEGSPESLVQTIKARLVKPPPYIAQSKEIVQKMKGLAKLTPREEQVIDMMFGLDVPEAGVAGPSMRTPEAGEKERQPGEQVGIKPDEQELLRRSAAGKTVKVGTTPDGKPVEVEIARGLQDVATMIGMSKQRVRQLFDAGYDKLRKAMIKINKPKDDLESKVGQILKATGVETEAITMSQINKLIFESLMKLHAATMEAMLVKGITISEQKITEADQKEIGDLLLFEAELRHHIIYWVVSGEVNEAFGI